MPVRIRLVLSLAVLATALLGAPSTSSAHELVTIDEGTLIVVGDLVKEDDLITIDYDSIKDEYIIGHDILDPIPAGCYRDPVEPFHKLHCPRSLIVNIHIATGDGSDKVQFGFDTTGFPGEITHGSYQIEVDTGPGDDQFDGGPENDKVNLGDGDDKGTTSGGKDSVDSGSGNDKVDLGPGDDYATTGPGNDTAIGGPGKDTENGGPGLDHLFGQAGADWLIGGRGIDFLIAGPGVDRCNGGPGADHQLSCQIGVNY